MTVGTVSQPRRLPISSASPGQSVASLVQRRPAKSCCSSVSSAPATAGCRSAFGGSGIAGGAGSGAGAGPELFDARGGWAGSALRLFSALAVAGSFGLLPPVAPAGGSAWRPRDLGVSVGCSASSSSEITPSRRTGSSSSSLPPVAWRISSAAAVARGSAGRGPRSSTRGRGGMGGGAGRAGGAGRGAAGAAGPTGATAGDGTGGRATAGGALASDASAARVGAGAGVTGRGGAGAVIGRGAAGCALSGAGRPPSSWVILATRRACRSSPENRASSHPRVTSTAVVSSSTRAPRQSTLASSSSRLCRAVKRS